MKGVYFSQECCPTSNRFASTELKFLKITKKHANIAKFSSASTIQEPLDGYPKDPRIFMKVLFSLFIAKIHKSYKCLFGTANVAIR